jgi:hypothetical protein
MKFGPLMRFLGVMTLIILSVAAILWIDRLPTDRIATLFGLSVTISDQVTPSPTPTLSVVPVADSVPTLSLGTVAVQTFSGTSLLRTASGTVVASDGLVVTTTAGAPYGAGYFYQVMTASGAAARASRVAYDAPSGLVLLKVETNELGTVPFVQDAGLRPGDEASVVAATVVLSRYTAVILPAAVVYATDRTVALSVDRGYMALLYGARVVDRQGRTLGLLRPGAAPGLIGAATVNAFVTRYLND